MHRGERARGVIARRGDRRERLRVDDARKRDQRERARRRRRVAAEHAAKVGRLRDGGDAEAAAAVGGEALAAEVDVLGGRAHVGARRRVFGKDSDRLGDSEVDGCSRASRVSTGVAQLSAWG